LLIKIEQLLIELRISTETVLLTYQGFFMKEVYKEKITNDTAWYADDIRNDVGAWLHPLTQEQKNEVLAALKAVKERCCTVESMEK